jgi:hypothetical protein
MSGTGAVVAGRHAGPGRDATLGGLTHDSRAGLPADRHPARTLLSSALLYGTTNMRGSDRRDPAAESRA